MDNVNEQLLDYIKAQVKAGVPVHEINRVLLANDWTAETVSAAFSRIGVDPNAAVSENVSSGLSQSSNAFAQENITMDKIIEKFISIAGALFLIVGFGYLIYANAWINLSMEIRLLFGFFFSAVIIGGSFSLQEKMRYFTDIGIGSGVLLLYGTLIYGSRTTELANAMIPEVVTLLTAVIFTIAVSYFASKRNSKVILMLGMVGAYITPFVIGQNDVWAGNVSFNSYLLYFLAINVAVFFIGREISVRDIIPLNMAGLFIGVSTLWGLTSDTVRSDALSGEFSTGILFLVIVSFSIWSILLSAAKFQEKDDGYLSLGYIAPVIWFAFNVQNLDTLNDITIGILYAVVAISCFAGWHVLSGTNTRYQHNALYAAGLISAFLAVTAFFKDFDAYTSILIAYSSLVFGFLYLAGTGKAERFISYIAVSLTGSILSLVNILQAESRFETALIVFALLPAMAAYTIAKNGSEKNLIPAAAFYSVVWSLVAGVYVLSEFVDYLDFSFILFYLLPLAVLGYLTYVFKEAPESMSHDTKSSMLRGTMLWFGLGFFTVFFTLVVSIYPAPTDTYIFTNTGSPADWILIKGILATVILFVGLYLSRKLQLEQVIKRPSFILVIFGYATLLLTGNYIISALANDLQVSLTEGGARAIATTLWWAAIAIYMTYIGVKWGRKYHSEKLLGLVLLGITLIKVVLYDISTMGMQNKIIVLMMVGGAMLLFSYMVRSKNLLENQDVEESQNTIQE